MATIAKLMVALGLSSDEYRKGLDQAESRTEGFTSKIASGFSKLSGVLAGATVVGLAGATSGVIGFAREGLSLNNSLEQTTAKLNAFTKDGAKTAEILQMIRDRAAKTPFEFNEMSAAAAALLPTAKTSGIELEKLIEKAEILAASNPMEGLEGAAFALKEAASGDLTSIIERFNLPRQRLKELKEQGVPAIEAVDIAMKEMGLDVDLVGNLANTAAGRWSTFKDTLFGLAATIMAPIFDTFSSGLATVNSKLEENAPRLEAFGTAIATWIAGSITKVVSVGRSLIDFFSDVGNALRGVITSFKLSSSVNGLYELSVKNLSDRLGVFGPVVAAVVVGFLRFKDSATDVLSALRGVYVALQLGNDGWGLLKLSLSNIHPMLGSFAEAIKTIIIQLQSGGFVSLFTAFEDGSTVFASFLQRLGIAEPIALALNTAISGIIGKFYEFTGVLQTSGPLSQAFGSQLATVAPGLAVVQGVIAAAIPIIMKLGEILFNAGVMASDSASLISSTWQSVQSMLQGVVTAILTLVTAVFGQIQIFLNAHGSEISAFLATTWQQILSIIQTAAQLIQAIVVPVFTAIAMFITAHSAEIQAILLAAWTILSNTISAALTLIQGTIKAALQLVQGDWEGAWETIKQTLSSVWGNIKAIIQASIGGVVDLIKKIPSMVSDVGSSIVKTISNGFTSAWNGFMSTVSGKLSELRNMLPFSEPKDHQSPLYGLGKSGMAIVDMVQRGINASPALNLNSVVPTGGLVGVASVGSSGVQSPSVRTPQHKAVSDTMAGITIGSIDARGADKGAGDRIKSALQEAMEASGQQAEIRVALGAF